MFETSNTFNHHAQRQIQTNLDSQGNSFRQNYLSALLLLGVTGSVGAAQAHEASFNAAPMPVPTFQATSAAHNVQWTNTNTNTNTSTTSQSHSNLSTLTHKSAVVFPTATLTGANALNLSTGAQSFTATQIGSFSSITLDLGGKEVSFNLGGKNASQMTAAEIMAAAEVAGGGKQTLTLNAQGEAVGGSIILNQNTLSNLDILVGGSLSSILVPKNVTLVDKVNDINLTGNLINYGKIVVGANSTTGGDVISATDTYNLAGASISSGRSDLTLLDSQALANSGSISGGNLYINSGSVTNSGTLSATTGSVAKIA